MIWRIIDGKTGHENQSLALVENLRALGPFSHIDVVAGSRDQPSTPHRVRPALVVGAGHRTHLPILRTARRFDCPSVVIMKPSIPAAFFDLCLIPEHDLARPPADNVVATKGMLNRLPATVPPKQKRGLVLVGGPSKHHGWDGDALREAISRVIPRRPDLDWHVTDSRRTPPEFLASLSSLKATLHPCADTLPDWLPAELLVAEEAWVTEDSMSMLYEALTAQARVGLFPMPRKSQRSRVVRGIDQLVAGGWTCFYSREGDIAPPSPPSRLHESSRCAREVLDRFFPTLA